MTACKLNVTDLTNWLDLLSVGVDGKLKLISLFQSLECDLVSKGVVSNFLNDCLSLKASTPDEALDHYNIFCGIDTRYFALCAVDPKSIDAATNVVVTVNSFVFHQYIMAKADHDSTAYNVLPQRPKSRNDFDVEEYCEQLNTLISDYDWYDKTGHLGKPFPDPRHVWFTEKTAADNEMLTNLRVVSNATKIRDALGLIDTTNDHYLLSLHFSATGLHKIIGLKMARPVFSDRGNTRFAVATKGSTHLLSSTKWGQTVHLGKLRDGKPQINGLPERICSPIPLKDVGASISVTPLGWVEIATDADDNTFIDHLCGGTTLDTIKNELIKRMTETP